MTIRMVGTCSMDARISSGPGRPILYVLTGYDRDNGLVFVRSLATGRMRRWYDTTYVDVEE